MPHAPSRHAFTLLELLAVLALAALALTLSIVTQQQDRAAAWKLLDIQRLGALQAASAAFTLSHQEKLPSLLPGGRQAASQFPPDARYIPAPDELVHPADSDLAASAKWAIHIIRKRGGRSPAEMPVPANWLAGISYSHLAVADFLAVQLPSQQFVSAADRFRLRWHDIAAYDAGAFGPFQPGDDFPARWPYSSSFELAPAAWSPDRSLNGNDGVVAQGASHRSFWTAGLNNTLGLRRLAEVRYPSRKICWFDSVGHYSGRRDWYYAQPECEGLFSTFDGAVHMLPTGIPRAILVPGNPVTSYIRGTKLNPGWDPLLSNSAFSTTFSYEPQPWEPPKRNGAYGSGGSSENLKGFQRFTRQGLAGIDFGGQEIR